MVSRPFFMTLPGYPGRMDENEILNDLEYLQQTYPGEVRRCQRRIAEILDKYDYEGSMIYDEYPDRLSLFRIADTISTILEQEAEKAPRWRCLRSRVPRLPSPRPEAWSLSAGAA